MTTTAAQADAFQDCRPDQERRSHCHRLGSSGKKAALEDVWNGRWRKLTGNASIRLSDGTMCEAEVHWYEAHGIGAKEHKIKRIFL
jgi:hypothetical protein